MSRTAVRTSHSSQNHTALETGLLRSSRDSGRSEESTSSSLEIHELIQF